MRPLKRLIGSLFFSYIQGKKRRREEKKGFENLPKASQSLPKTSQRLPQRLPKLPQSLPESPQRLPQSLPESPKASQASAKPPQSRPKARLAPNGISRGQILLEWHLNQTCPNKNRAGMQTRASKNFEFSNRQQKSPFG